jgi:hypothetical protein
MKDGLVMMILFAGYVHGDQGYWFFFVFTASDWMDLRAI